MCGKRLLLYVVKKAISGYQKSRYGSIIVVNIYWGPINGAVTRLYINTVGLAAIERLHLRLRNLPRSKK